MACTTRESLKFQFLKPVKVSVTKVCRFDGGVCRNSCCSTLSPMGFVELCSRHRNPNGRFRFRKVA